MTDIERYRAANTEGGPAVICQDDEPGTVLALVGRQQDAEEIADALNNHLRAVDPDDPKVIETLARVIENRHGTLLGIGDTLREALAEIKREASAP